MSSQFERHRDLVDNIDRKIADLIGQRREITSQITKIKKAEHLPLRDERREEKIRALALRNSYRFAVPVEVLNAVTDVLIQDVIDGDGGPILALEPEEQAILDSATEVLCTVRRSHTDELLQVIPGVATIGATNALRVLHEHGHRTGIGQQEDGLWSTSQHSVEILTSYLHGRLTTGHVRWLDESHDL